MGVAAWAMAMPVAPEIVGMADVVAAVSAIVPGSRTISDTRLCTADNREIAHGLARLLPAVRAGHKLKDVAHRHALIEARSTGIAVILVKRHE
jgi:hypothetical protein